MKWTALASAGLWLCAGCGAAGDDNGGGLTVRPEQQTPDNTGGTGSTSPNQPNTPPTTGTGGPDFNVGEEPDDGITPMGCQQAEREFVPNIPTVYMLVDRSGTMFDPIQDNVSAWSALRGGVLDVMRELEASVQFGFAAFSGANAGVANGVPQCNLEVPSVEPALNNFQAISTVYTPLERPTNSKDTPTLLALQEVAAQLRAVQTPGDKYILFVTDGEPDYCDDGNPICPPDSVVGLLQSLSSTVDATGAPQTPIHTLVFGVTSPTATIREDVLQAFANAGAGAPVIAPSQNANQPADPNSIWDQCNGVPGWAADFALTGKPLTRGQTVGTYSTEIAPALNAPVYRPDPTDQAALTEEIRVALAGVRSCTFDLGEDGVKVDLTRTDLGDRARVIVNGTAVVFDAANGWSMANETTVTLAGAACDMWRTPDMATSISFDFPCDIFVPR
jgi:hypothetical protein